MTDVREETRDNTLANSKPGRGNRGKNALEYTHKKRRIGLHYDWRERQKVRHESIQIGENPKRGNTDMKEGKQALNEE